MQAQLFNLHLTPADEVYTPDWAAYDMVKWFDPSGTILEPCKGDGAILRHLPVESEWCEIQEGRDFFEWYEPVDWIITNPPYSLFREFLIHGLEVSSNVVYLIPLKNFFSAYSIMEWCKFRGWIKHIRVYGAGQKLKFPMGNPIGAVHWQKNYQGDTSWSWHESTTCAQDDSALLCYAPTQIKRRWAKKSRTA